MLQEIIFLHTLFILQKSLYQIIIFFLILYIL
jgi:hypothetical protein